MNAYNIAAVTLAVLIYIHLARQIRSGSADQNLATWFSWVLLDVVAGISLFVQGGNWYLLAIYVVGGSVITFLIFKSAKFTLGWVEITCFLLVILCIIMWTQSGPWYATVISTIGVAIATYPQIKDSFLLPKTVPMEVYVGFTFVNSLATAAGKEWTIEERLYPAVCTGLCVLVVGFTSKKYFAVERPGNA